MSYIQIACKIIKNLRKKRKGLREFKVFLKKKGLAFDEQTPFECLIIYRTAYNIKQFGGNSLLSTLVVLQVELT